MSPRVSTWTALRHVALFVICSVLVERECIAIAATCEALAERRGMSLEARERARRSAFLALRRAGRLARLVELHGRMILRALDAREPLLHELLDEDDPLRARLEEAAEAHARACARSVISDLSLVSETH